MRAAEFLDLYRELEEELALHYQPKNRRYSSLIFEYINDPSNMRFREEMNTCRELRNLLTHHAEIGGNPVAEPSEEILQILRDMLSYIRKPPLAMEQATLFDKLLVTHPDQRAFSIMRKMRDRGFSHVPVLDHGKFCGIFSVSVPFAYLLEHPGSIAEDFKISDFGSYIEIGNHCTERFLFAPKTLTCADAGEAFETVGSGKKRLAMILLTEHGKPEQPILGVLTPFDVISVGKE